MEEVYPNNPFTAVIMFDKRSSFSYKPEEFLKGKTICVIGTVKNYKGKPEIVAEKEGRLRCSRVKSLHNSLLRSQTLHRIRYRRFNGLKADGYNGDK